MGLDFLSSLYTATKTDSVETSHPEAHVAETIGCEIFFMYTGTRIKLLTGWPMPWLPYPWIE